MEFLKLVKVLSVKEAVNSTSKVLVNYIGVDSDNRYYQCEIEMPINQVVQLLQNLVDEVNNSEDITNSKSNAGIQHTGILVFQNTGDACDFKELKQKCIFYMVYKNVQMVCVKVSHTDAVMLESSTRTHSFFVVPETIVFPYYLKPTNHLQRNGIQTILDNPLMT